MKVVINPSLREGLVLNTWPINFGETDAEPQRISVDKDNYSYSLVVEDDKVSVEIWSIDKNGDLIELLHTQTLPNVEL